MSLHALILFPVCIIRNNYKASSFLYQHGFLLAILILAFSTVAMQGRTLVLYQ